LFVISPLLDQLLEILLGDKLVVILIVVQKIGRHPALEKVGEGRSIFGISTPASWYIILQFDLSIFLHVERINGLASEPEAR
jgi:hypothetical protein